MGQRWRTLGKVPIKDIHEIVKDTVRKNFHESVTVYIGTDSQQIDNFTSIVTVISIYIHGKGGRVFYTKSRVPRIKYLRERLIKESECSIAVAKMIEPTLRELEYEAANVDISLDLGIKIHADINTNDRYASERFVKEIVGYIRGNGYECAIKPNSQIATNVADKVVR